MLLLREGHLGLASELESNISVTVKGLQKGRPVHERLLLSVSSLRGVESGLKDRVGAGLHPVNLHLCVLCSISQHSLDTADTALQVSPQPPRKRQHQHTVRGWETQGSPAVTRFIVIF